jgi:hypothetical protein
MMLGLKKYETRPRLTHIREDVAICSGLRQPDAVGLTLIGKYGIPYSTIGFGLVLCVVNLYGCIPVEQMTRVNLQLSEQEKEWGNYEIGRFVWITKNLRPLKQPIPIKGRQGWFNLDIDTTNEVLKQIA